MLRNIPSGLPSLTQLLICLGVAVFLPVMIWMGTWSLSLPSDPRTIQEAIAAIQKKIDDAETPGEKAFQAREMEIAREKYTAEGRGYRERVLWSAYPIGLMGLALGVLGLASPKAIPTCEIKSALQQAEERDDRERRNSRWYCCHFGPYFFFPELTLGLFLFASIYRYAPVAWGLLLGGIFSLTIAGYPYWP